MTRAFRRVVWNGGAHDGGSRKGGWSRSGSLGTLAVVEVGDARPSPSLDVAWVSSPAHKGWAWILGGSNVADDR